MPIKLIGILTENRNRKLLKCLEWLRTKFFCSSLSYYGINTRSNTIPSIKISHSNFQFSEYTIIFGQIQLILLKIRTSSIFPELYSKNCESLSRNTILPFIPSFYLRFPHIVTHKGLLDYFNCY